MTADFREVSLLARQFYDRIQRGENMAAVLHHLVQYPPYISQAIAVRMSRIASAPLATAMIDSLIAMYEKVEKKAVVPPSTSEERDTISAALALLREEYDKRHPGRRVREAIDLLSPLAVPASTPVPGEEEDGQ